MARPLKKWVFERRCFFCNKPRGDNVVMCDVCLVKRQVKITYHYMVVPK